MTGPVASLIETVTCTTPDETFDLGRSLGSSFRGGELLLLSGGLGAGKTLLVKGILTALDFDVDEVTSPSFTLVNLYRTNAFDVYHIDLWRLDQAPDPAAAVGLDEILDDPAAITLIEWADRLKTAPRARRMTAIEIAGDGDEVRTITIRHFAPDK